MISYCSINQTSLRCHSVALKQITVKRSKGYQLGFHILNSLNLYLEKSCLHWVNPYIHALVHVKLPIFTHIHALVHVKLSICTHNFALFNTP